MHYSCLRQDVARHVDVPFGGKIFLLGGDFRPVLPVLPRKSRSAIVENCLKSSPLWPLLEVHKFAKNMCVLEDQSEFADWLLRLGNGTLSATVNDIPDRITIPKQCDIVANTIVNDMFSDISETSELADKVILTPKNEDSVQLNQEVLQKLPGDAHIYFSADEALSDDDVSMYPVEFLNSLTPSGMPPHKLSLKTGAVIMLLRNLDIRKGLCNGHPPYHSPSLRMRARC